MEGASRRPCRSSTRSSQRVATRSTCLRRFLGARLRRTIAPRQATTVLARAVDDLSGPRAGVIALVDHDRAIDEHKRHALGILLRIFIRGGTRNRCGVEYDDISPIAFLQEPAILQSQRLSW